MNLCGLDWQVCSTEAGAWPNAHEAAARSSTARWVTAQVPGTAQADLLAAGAIDALHPTALHDLDLWYRCTLSGQGDHQLVFDGVATLAEVHLDDTCLAQSASMFAPIRADVSLRGQHTLYLVCRSLTAHLAGLKLPRARWRVGMVPQQALRGVRTTLLGHMPSWCPDVAVVGPWRAVHLVSPQDVSAVALQATACGTSSGKLSVTFECQRDLRGWQVSCAGHTAAVVLAQNDQWQAFLQLDAVAHWWPRGYGPQALHDVTLSHGTEVLSLGRAGFRSVEVDRGPDGMGFTLVVSGQPVFARGAVYTPPDVLHPGGLAGAAQRLQQLADMGANMLRIAGPFCYEDPAFFGLCDELGLMVWQDLMLANFDYPLRDATFAAQLEAEVVALLTPLAAHPSLVVLCGGSEVMQQAAMLGLPAQSEAFAFFNERLPVVCEAVCPGLVVVPNSPCGGELPFSVRTGVSHYYGVGAYERPLVDARLAAPRFITECLAFAHVPEPCTVEAMGVPAVHHPAWKQGVPRDRNVSWDFEDTRDHYLEHVFGLDAALLRRTDPVRYLQASRALTAHIMSCTLSEWRRPGSPTAGALVFTAGDLQAGAGWGLIDVHGEPKAAYHGFKQVAQPVALLLTDEGCDGLDVHLVNDTPDDRQFDVSLSVLRQGRTVVASGHRPVRVSARNAVTLTGTALLGAFFDLTYAFRFGPPGHDEVVVTATDAEAGGSDPLQAVYFPHGACSAPLHLGLSAQVEERDGCWWLLLRTDALARFVHIDDRAYRPRDNHFHLPPGETRQLQLTPRSAAAGPPAGVVTALNALDVLSYRGNL